MVKDTQTIRWLLPTDCLSAFNHFGGLALQGLSVNDIENWCKHFWTSLMFSRYESLDTKKLKEGLADLRLILYSYRNHSIDLYSKSTDWFLYLWHISLKRSNRVKTSRCSKRHKSSNHEQFNHLRMYTSTQRITVMLIKRHNEMRNV